MYVLIGIALKSLIIAGVTLGLLALMKRRSAAERSWIAHIGLLALVIMALAPLVLPSWTIEPLLWPGRAGHGNPGCYARRAGRRPIKSTLPAAPRRCRPQGADEPSRPRRTALYAVPAAILLLITLLALSACRLCAPAPTFWSTALAERPRPSAAAHGLQARHRLAHQQ
jgi:hypothetical protein